MMAYPSPNAQRALELAPNLAEARRAHSWYLLLAGRAEEGLAEMRLAEEVEPLVPISPTISDGNTCATETSTLRWPRPTKHSNWIPISLRRWHSKDVSTWTRK